MLMQNRKKSEGEWGITRHGFWDVPRILEGLSRILSLAGKKPGSKKGCKELSP